LKNLQTNISVNDAYRKEKLSEGEMAMRMEDMRLKADTTPTHPLYVFYPSLDGNQCHRGYACGQLWRRQVQTQNRGVLGWCANVWEPKYETKIGKVGQLKQGKNRRWATHQQEDVHE
jgi:hypothetical protein